MDSKQQFSSAKDKHNKKDNKTESRSSADENENLLKTKNTFNHDKYTSV